MNTFVSAINNNDALTANGMKALKSSKSSTVDLFYNIGASRGKDIIPAFTSAYIQDKDLATRIALWARDVRGGAGERQLFRNILLNLDKAGDFDRVTRMLNRVPELGRWDDLLLDFSPEVKAYAYGLIRNAIENGDGLCAKWMPRKGKTAVELRNFLGMTPKQYRKTLVNLTSVVESQMCANDWDDINFSHVPSLASSRYRNAFNRHTDKYREYVEALVSDDPEVRKTVKANAGAVYPYDVIKQIGINAWGPTPSGNVLNHIIGQWDALPNYMNDELVLPLVDVSGSMTSGVRNTNLTAMEIAVSLGLYCADKNTGPFKDTFLTFSGNPNLVTLKGNIVQKVNQMVKSSWGYNTDLKAAFKEILSVAVKNDVPQEDMPTVLLILSDMQFDAVDNGKSANQMIKKEYKKAGYELPKVVYWNIQSYDNTPVKFDKNGTALVSGFSPAIMKSVLANDLEQFTPENVMLKTIMSERYNF